ncbi:hypothetical protein MHU86_9881 [Fragilaria crotonensis]|nr:hypothetical protein MHU86_9881 [Fragilaria crotonensis]
MREDNETLKAATKEEEIVSALGITMTGFTTGLPTANQDTGEHVVVPDPHADEVDLSDLRGTKAPTKGPHDMMAMKTETDNDELEALAELVPELKSKATKERENHTMTVDISDKVAAQIVVSKEANEGPIEVSSAEVETKIIAEEKLRQEQKMNALKTPIPLTAIDSMVMQDGFNADDDASKPAPIEVKTPLGKVPEGVAPVVVPGDEGEQNLGGFDNVDSDDALNSDSELDVNTPTKGLPNSGEYANISSAASQSTATQTHEVRTPLYLATFKPATGCTNASDFIVRCFVARLRSGITVVKHGRSRWCKSRLRILHIHPDGRSLSWKPAVGEPTSSKRPPKLDLSTCEEVRHAWSPDPLNPMFTGTPILRQKCEAANAHKSFALIFPKRTVDITALTADQCKVLMEGFSALCFRLQVANLAGRGSKKAGTGPEEEEVATSTASVTLTNSSMPHSPSGNINRANVKKR